MCINHLSMWLFHFVFFCITGYFGIDSIFPLKSSFSLKVSGWTSCPGFKKGNSYFDGNGILPLEPTLLSDMCD